MKKLVSFISALTMCAVMAAPMVSSAAAGTLDQSATLPHQDTRITVGYTPDKCYLITLPDTADMDLKNTTSITFEASDVRLSDGESITVTAEGSGKLTYKDKNGVDDKIDYTISSTTDGDALVLDTETNTLSKTFDIELGSTDAAKYANPYTDQITFTVDIAPAE